MAAKPEDVKPVRDRIHNLDLDFPEYQKIFEEIAREFLIQNEGKEKEVYVDTSKIGPQPGGGCKTVGIGFNMDDQSARQAWESVFKGTVSFDEVYSKKRLLTDSEIEALFIYSRAIRLKEIKNYFKGVWDKLKPNERLAIESAYYVGPNIIIRSKGAERIFFKSIKEYVKTEDPKKLEDAVFELRERSNKSKNDGVKKRRMAEATMLASYECPFYSKPSDPPIPRERTIRITLGETIIPCDSDREAFIRFLRQGTMPSAPFLDKEKSENYYIWRTQKDSRVRFSHVMNEGKVFDRRFPPPTGNPGEEYGCRCQEDPFIPSLVALVPGKPSAHR